MIQRPIVQEPVCGGCGKLKGEPHAENCIQVSAARKYPFNKREKPRSAAIEAMWVLKDPCGGSVLDMGIEIN